MQSLLSLIRRGFLVSLFSLQAVVVSAQLFSRTINSTPAEKLVVEQKAADGGLYIASNNDAKELSVIKYDNSNNIVWQMVYKISGDDVQVIDIEEDNDKNVVVLFNDISTPITTRFPAILKLDKATGSVLNVWKYKITTSTSPQSGAALSIGTDGNYYIGFNELTTGFDYDKCVFLKIDNTTGAVLHKQQFFVSSRMAIYDIAQLNSDEWIIVGAYLNSSIYNCFIIKYNVSTATGVKKLFALSPSHCTFDKVAINKTTGTIYTVSNLGYGSQNDAGFMAIDPATLTYKWCSKLTTTGNGENERATSLNYDEANNQLLFSGSNTVGNQFCFIACADASNGYLLWSKNIAGMSVKNSSGLFRTLISNNEVVFVSLLNKDIIWGREYYSSKLSDCYEDRPYTYTIMGAVANDFSFLKNSIIGITETDVTINPQITAYTETGNCITVLNPPETKIGFKDPICLGGCIAFTDNSTNANNWEWFFESGTPAIYSGKTPPNVCYSTSGTYSVRLITSNLYGSDTLDTAIMVNPLPNVTTFNDTQWCAFDTFKLMAANALTYQWKGFTADDILLQDNKFIPANTNTYTVVGTDNNGCKDSASFKIIVLQPPAPVGYNKNRCLDEAIVLKAENPGYSYLWSTGNTDDSISVENKGVYEVTISNACFQETYTFNIGEEDCTSHYFVPNAFRPNGDGLNDVFFITGNHVKVLELTIFSRWGEKLFEGSNDNNYTWDGTYKGEIVEGGTYIYIGIVQLRSGRELLIKGTVTVVR